METYIAKISVSSKERNFEISGSEDFVSKYLSELGKLLDIQRKQIQEEMLEQLIEETKESIEEAKDLYKKALQKLMEALEHQRDSIKHLPPN